MYISVVADGATPLIASSSVLAVNFLSAFFHDSLAPPAGPTKKPRYSPFSSTLKVCHSGPSCQKCSHCFFDLLGERHSKGDDGHGHAHNHGHSHDSGDVRPRSTSPESTASSSGAPESHGHSHSKVRLLHPLAQHAHAHTHTLSLLNSLS